MKSRIAAVVSALLLVSFAALAADPPDVAGSKDPSFLKRYQGSRIVSYNTISFDRYNIYGPDPANPGKTAWQPIEGQITRTIYHEPSGHTVLELLRNYEQAVDEAGFTRSYEWQGADQDFGSSVYRQSWQPAGDFVWTYLGLGGAQQMAYFTAKATKDNQDITLAVFILQYKEDKDVTYQESKKTHFAQNEPTVLLDVVTAKAVENKMVMVKAADMADALATKGSIDLYGIYFDTDKTVLKPESDKTLDEVANLLKIDRSLKLEISGHTDNTGDKAHNLQLSEGRAQAVVDALTKKYGIDAARLQAKGYGDTKPVADNGSEDGRAKNRRVELKKI